MRHHWLKRACTALVLLWFVVATTEPAALHLCPVHGAPASAEQHAAGHSHSDHTSGGQATCTCLGDCSAGNFSLAFASPEERFVAEVPRNDGALPSPLEQPRAVAPDFLLPYANGPPEVHTLA